MSRIPGEATPTAGLFASLVDRRRRGVLLTALGVVLALAAFAGLASEVLEGDVFAMDRVIIAVFRAPGHPDLMIGPPWVQEAARDITALGGFTVLTLVSLVTTLLLVLHRRRAQALVFAATVILAQLVTELLKAFIARPRPELSLHHDWVYASSFPSGHALMTPVVYLTLAAVIAHGERSRSLRDTVTLCAGGLIVAVGVSRVYLGVHWPTDVLAGWALGIAIALAASVAVERAAAAR